MNKKRGNFQRNVNQRGPGQRGHSEVEYDGGWQGGRDMTNRSAEDAGRPWGGQGQGVPGRGYEEQGFQGQGFPGPGGYRGRQQESEYQGNAGRYGQGGGFRGRGESFGSETGWQVGGDSGAYPAGPGRFRGDGDYHAGNGGQGGDRGGYRGGDGDWQGGDHGDGWQGGWNPQAGSFGNGRGQGGPQASYGQGYGSTDMLRGEGQRGRHDQELSFGTDRDGAGGIQGVYDQNGFGNGMSPRGSLRHWGTGVMEGPHTGRGPKGFKRSDERVREEVSERLEQHGHVDATEIEVAVQGGEVTLKGTVNSREEKRLAEEAVEHVPGVKDVQNQIRVVGGGKNRGSSADAGSNAGAQSSKDKDRDMESNARERR